MARIIVADMGRITDKWQRRSGSAGEEYRVGVETSTADWAGSTTAAAGPDFAKGFEPYRAALAGIDLPLKGPRGAEGNFVRSQTVGRALNALRVKR